MEKILQDIENDLVKRADILEHKSNWASTLADPCLRRLYYYRTNWQEQEMPSPKLQGIFETGKEIEDLTILNLNRIGVFSQPKWELVAKGFKINDTFLRKHNIGSKIDVALHFDGEILGPVEIKSVNPNSFAQINSIDDFKKCWWMRGYKAQLTTYMLGTNCEQGWFLLVNKSNHYDIKLLRLELDFEFAETLIKKADAVNEAVDTKTVPYKINDVVECRDCSFLGLCCPDFETGGKLTYEKSEELSAALSRLQELEPVKTEIADLEKCRDSLLTKGKDIACGKFLILWKHISGNRKPSPGGPFEQWRKTIIFKE